jgi:hypothetical protein
MRKLFLILIITISGSTLFSQTPIPYNNFPILLDDTRRPFQKAGIPLIADIDKDGQKETIFVTLDYNGVANPPIMLHVLNSDGINYLNFPKGYNELIHDVASGDVNGDGFLEIALRMTFSFDVIDRFGNSLPGFPVNYSDGDVNPIKFISLYDLDNDGKLEIIVSKNNNVSVFNYNGSLRNGWPKYIPGSSKYNPAIGDLNGDGYAEMIFTSFKQIGNNIDSGAVHVFKHNGESFSNNFPIYFDSTYFSWSSSPSLFIHSVNSNLSFFTVVLDIDRMGGTELHKFLKINLNGDILFTKYYNSTMDFGTLVMGDIDRNGDLDFATGSQYWTNFSAFNETLNRFHGSWPNIGLGEHWATASIGRLSYGNNLNVISNTWFAFNPNGYGYIYAYTNDGKNLPWSPLRPEGLVIGISLADLNNDGSVELIATSSRTGYETFLHIWTFPGIPFTHEDFPWPQYGHDRYRTNQYGFIPPDEPVGIQPMNTNVPASYNLYQNFPNPFNPATSIKFDIAKSGNVKLIIFDLLGREVSTLVNENLNPGTYQVSFDGSNFSSGVYFYQLQGEGYLNTMKMIMIK